MFLLHPLQELYCVPAKLKDMAQPGNRSLIQRRLSWTPPSKYPQKIQPSKERGKHSK